MPLFGITVTKHETDIALKYTTYLVGHYGYFLVNCLNILGLVVFEGLIFGRLQKNYLVKLSLGACIFQVTSCICSIWRYNIMDEYNRSIVVPGTILSVIAYAITDVSYLYLSAPNSEKFVKIGTLFFIVVAVVQSYLAFLDPFEYIRPFVGLSQIYGIVALFQGKSAFAKGTIKIDALSKEHITKIFNFCISMNIFSFLMTFTVMPTFYVFLGLPFTSNILIMILVGANPANYNLVAATTGETTGLV